MNLFKRKDKIDQIKDVNDQLKEKGNLSCMACGLPSGFKGVTLKKIGGGKYVYTSCAKK